MTAPSALIDVWSVPDTPSLVVDLGVVESNIDRMAGMARKAGVALRPHVKTHKIPRLARRQIESGASGITVAKLGEAEVMVEGGLDDILIAYPIVGDAKSGRLIDLHRNAYVSVAIDSLDIAENLDRAFGRVGRELDVLLEIDTGMHRCGAPPGVPAANLASRIAQLRHVQLVGILTHEGHAYAGRGRRHTGFVGRSAATAMVATARAIRQRGIELKVVSLGSSVTAEATASAEGVTEIRPGTYIFNDRSQLLQGACLPQDCAARVIVTVVSRPSPDRAVIDAGSKVLGLDLAIVRPSVAGHGAIVGVVGWSIDRVSEEHGVLVKAGRGTRLSVGQRLEVVPNHICTVVNLFDRIHVAIDGRVTDEWPVAARGRSR